MLLFSFKVLVSEFGSLKDGFCRLDKYFLKSEEGLRVNRFWVFGLKIEKWFRNRVRERKVWGYKNIEKVNNIWVFVVIFICWVEVCCSGRYRVRGWGSVWELILKGSDVNNISLGFLGIVNYYYIFFLIYM